MFPKDEVPKVYIRRNLQGDQLDMFPKDEVSKVYIRRNLQGDQLDMAVFFWYLVKSY